MPIRRRPNAWLVPILLFALCTAAVLMVNVTPSAASAPSVSITPSGPYHNGETVTVSVGPNSLFTPERRIIFIECSDPGGAPAGLPTSVRSCDGNTTQADTVIVASNGSFAEHHFVLYSLPNQNLAELPDGVPVCDSSHSCVLYIGENQEDFTQPKVFSAPFSVAPTAGSAPTAAGSNPGSVGQPTAPQTSQSATASPATPAPASAGSSVPAASASSAALSPGQAAGGTLAFTGMRPMVVWMLWIGSLMFLLGTVGRRMIRRGQA
jgi:hypothetical protein